MDTISVIESGMLNDVQRLHTISHNLANLSTTGFKKEIAVTRAFHDYVQGTANGSGLDPSVTASPVLGTITDYTAGALKYSANPLDVALDGDGYFVVAAPWGEALTRQGNLSLDVEGRLVTAGGYPVLGAAGEIKLSNATPRIDQQGNIYDGNSLVDRLRVVQVDDPTSLERVGGGLFATGASSGLKEGVDLRVRQGYTEASNVTSMHEMIKMIETMRHFEASQKLARGYNDMLDRAINVLGEL